MPIRRRYFAVLVLPLLGVMGWTTLSGSTAVSDCAEQDHLVQAVYVSPRARPIAKGMAEDIRARITLATEIASDYLAASGPGHRIAWACEDGALSVPFELAGYVDDGDLTFVEIIEDLKERGYDRSDRLYAIFLEHTGDYPSVGEATYGSHDKAPQYALIANWSGRWTLHEVGHMLGAVPPEAPHVFQGPHCIEQWDVMCRKPTPEQARHQPPGMRRLAEINCPDKPAWYFDCNHDDYYLHSGDWWDVADSLFLTPAD